jgi:hypothetical protein
VDVIKSARNADGRLELFVRGADRAVWHSWQTAPNNGWSGWASLGGWVDMIAMGQNADGRLEIFARGSDGAMWHNWQTCSGQRSQFGTRMGSLPPWQRGVGPDQNSLAYAPAPE